MLQWSGMCLGFVFDWTGWIYCCHHVKKYIWVVKGSIPHSKTSIFLRFVFSVQRHFAIKCTITKAGDSKMPTATSPNRNIDITVGLHKAVYKKALVLDSKPTTFRIICCHIFYKEKILSSQFVTQWAHDELHAMSRKFSYDKIHLPGFPSKLLLITSEERNQVTMISFWNTQHGQPAKTGREANKRFCK